MYHHQKAVTNSFDFGRPSGNASRAPINPFTYEPHESYPRREWFSDWAPEAHEHQSMAHGTADSGLRTEPSFRGSGHDERRAERIPERFRLREFDFGEVVAEHKSVGTQELMLARGRDDYDAGLQRTLERLEMHGAPEKAVDTTRVVGHIKKGLRRKHIHEAAVGAAAGAEERVVKRAEQKARGRGVAAAAAAVAAKKVVVEPIVQAAPAAKAAAAAPSPAAKAAVETPLPGDNDSGDDDFHDVPTTVSTTILERADVLIREYDEIANAGRTEATQKQKDEARTVIKRLGGTLSGHIKYVGALQNALKKALDAATGGGGKAPRPASKTGSL
jgi:hypothetical protein